MVIELGATPSSDAFSTRTRHLTVTEACLESMHKSAHNIETLLYSQSVNDTDSKSCLKRNRLKFITSLSHVIESPNGSGSSHRPRRNSFGAEPQRTGVDPL